MSTQTDVKVFPQPITIDMANAFTGGVEANIGYFPLATYTGSVSSADLQYVNRLGPCRVKQIIIVVTSGDDGYDYGEPLKLRDGQNGPIKLDLYFPSAPYTAPGATTTFSLLMPGEGILFQDSVWVYLDSYGYYYYNDIYIVYG